MGLDFDQYHVQEILEDQGGREWHWFSCHLLRLICKADKQNRELLRIVFPRHVQLYESWNAGLKPPYSFVEEEVHGNKP